MPRGFDKTKLGPALFIVAMGVVGYGFSEGWFTPHPARPGAVAAEPQVQLILDTDAPPPRSGSGVTVGSVSTDKKKPGETEPRPESDAPLTMLGKPAPATDEAPGKSRFASTGPGGNAPASGLQPGSGMLRMSSRPEDALHPARLAGGAFPAASGGLTAPEKPLRYSGHVNGRWIDEVGPGGATVELDDGSVWEVEPVERMTSQSWPAASNVTLSQTGASAYPYRMTAQNRSAEVRLVKAPSNRRKPNVASEEMPTDQ
jgi:hypothetical protein